MEIHKGIFVILIKCQNIITFFHALWNPSGHISLFVGKGGGGASEYIAQNKLVFIFEAVFQEVYNDMKKTILKLSSIFNQCQIPVAVFRFNPVTLATTDKRGMESATGHRA